MKERERKEKERKEKKKWEKEKGKRGKEMEKKRRGNGKREKGKKKEGVSVRRRRPRTRSATRGIGHACVVVRDARDEGEQRDVTAGFRCLDRVLGKIGRSGGKMVRAQRRKTFETILARDLFRWILGCYKPTPLKMNLVLEIRLAPKQVGKFLLQSVFTFPRRFFYSMSAPLDSANPYFGVSRPPGDSVQNLDRYLLVS